jgi:hypothetical protein
MLEIPRQAAELLASQGGLCSTRKYEWVQSMELKNFSLLYGTV